MTQLNNRAVLVSLSISQWSAGKLDKGVTSDVCKMEMNRVVQGDTLEGMKGA